MKQKLFFLIKKFSEKNDVTDILVLNTGGPPIIEFKKITKEGVDFIVEHRLEEKNKLPNTKAKQEFKLAADAKSLTRERSGEMFGNPDLLKEEGSPDGVRRAFWLYQAVMATGGTVPLHIHEWANSFPSE